MIGIVATIRIKAGQQTAFEAAMRPFVEAVRSKEPGARFYSLTRKQGSATEYVMMEQYDSQVAIDTHNATPHFQELFGKIGPLLDGAPDLVTVDVLV
jgi:quinol monooxygenase YgiN